MNAFETSTTVQSLGDIRVTSVPFAPGTEVEVTINPKRRNAEEFADAWNRVCRELRTKLNAVISDEEIQQEIHDHRAGR